MHFIHSFIKNVSVWDPTAHFNISKWGSIFLEAPEDDSIRIETRCPNTIKNIIKVCCVWLTHYCIFYINFNTLCTETKLQPLLSSSHMFLFLLILTPHFLQIDFNLILPFPFLPRCSPCLSGFLNKELYTLYIFSMHATCPVSFILFDIITFKNRFYNQISFCDSFSLQTQLKIRSWCLNNQ
jgi:hypothetical protein